MTKRDGGLPGPAGHPTPRNKPMQGLAIKQAYQRALGHFQNGLLAEAAEITLMILDRHPRHLDSLQLMGLIAIHSGRDDLAIPYLEKACELAPRSCGLLSNLGEALRRAGRLESAITTFHRAIALKPRHAEAHNNLGIAFKESGKMPEALASFRQAVALDANHSAARNNLGAALLDTGNLDEAAATFLNLVALDPNDAGTLVNLGATLAGQEKFAPAITAYRQAIAIDPNLAVAWRNLGNALEKSNRLDEAIPAFQRALALDPSLAEVHVNLGNAWKESGRLEHALASYRGAISVRPDYPDAHSNFLFGLHYSPSHDARRIFEEHRLWSEGQAARWKTSAPRHSNHPHPERRLRVGYVSPDFRNHPVSRFLLPLLENHHKAEIEVFTYAQGHADDEWTARVLAHADHRRNLTGLSDDQAADLIRKDGIDILVDLALHTAGNRLLVFARKPAPVQVTWLAYAGTSGLDAMDYRLSDPHLDPPGSDESVYSETTLRLPRSYWCYQTEVDAAVVPPPVLSNHFVTFGSLNNFCKVNEEVLDLWARLLGDVPESRLLLHANEGEHRQRVRDFMQSRGIGSGRIDFASNVPIRNYLEQYNHIDIALDPFPYGGGTTTCDALWMGVPVVTLRGLTAVGRGGASILSNVGLPEFIANSPENYLAIASALAADQGRLRDLRATLRNRMLQSPLMDAATFSGDMENAYRTMWRKWCDTAAR